jgi:rhodanese-related sulfurtransferase
MSEPAELPLETDVANVAAMRARGDDFLLLDVREEDEYAVARIEGSLLLPMSQLRERVDELQDHRQRRVVVQCHHGVRSLRVTQLLRELGFARAQSMAGGIEQWSLQIDSGVPRY